MSDWKEIYASAGGDPEKALTRLGGNEEMLRRFLRLFTKDDSFPALQKDLASGKTEDAFRAAHTLKGVCAALGFDGLYEKSSEITELLRHGELETATAHFPSLAEAYEKTIDAINRVL